MSIFHSIPICCRYCKSYSIIPLFACWSHSLPCQCLIDVLKSYYIFFSFFFFFFFQAFTALFYIIKAFPWEFLTLGNAPCSHSDPWQPGNDFYFFFFPSLNMCSSTQYQTCCSCRGTTCYSVSSLVQCHGELNTCSSDQQRWTFSMSGHLLGLSGCKIMAKRVYWLENVSFWIVEQKLQKYKA